MTVQVTAATPMPHDAAREAASACPPPAAGAPIGASAGASTPLERA